MVTDFEAAWADLQELIASKPQHGRPALLIAMAEIQAKHRVQGDLTRLLRLYGVEVHASAETEPAGSPNSSGEDLPDRTCEPRRINDRGGHDVRSTGRSRAAA